MINEGRRFPVTEVCLFSEKEWRDKKQSGREMGEVGFHKRDLAAQTDKRWRRGESVRKHSGKDGEIE